MSASGRPTGEQLLSLLSHELRTPLAVIAGNGELLLRVRDDEASRKQVAEHIVDAAARLSVAIDAVLSVLALDSAGMRPNARRVELEDVVSDAIAAVPAPVTVEQNGGWPAVSVDPDWMTGALAALVATASSSLGEGGRLALRAEQRPELALLSLVSSDQWVRLERSRLVLYAVRRVLEVHGGSLAVQDEPGGGSTVSLFLPLSETPAVGSFRVLIVDDDESVRRLLRATLPHEGFDVVEAQDGLEALDLLRAGERPSLVLLDWTMPGAPGAEVLAEFRRLAPTIPVIVVTAELDPKHRETAESLGADAFLTKPFSPLRLLGLVERLLPARRA